MRLCLVTDRRRLGEAMGRPAADWGDLLVEQARGAALGGVDILHLREPDLDARALADLARRILDAAQGSSMKLVINDRADVALAVGAHGVHLRESSCAPAAVARLSPRLVIGCAVHAADIAALRLRADYLVAGTVLPTPSKPEPVLLGWEGLRAIVRAAGDVPVLGIGGLDETRVGQLIEAGAAGLAAIGAFIPSDPAADTAGFVQKCAKNMRLAFDSRGPVS